MGLKTTNYEIEKFGITIPEAYARLTNISIDLAGNAFGTFEIHQNREDIVASQALDKVYLDTIIDKDLPVHSQLYTVAKENLFVGWEDDIVVEEETTNEEIIIEEPEEEGTTTSEVE